MLETARPVCIASAARDRKQPARRSQREAGKTANKSYIGAASAKAGEISVYRNPNGHGVTVVHEPAEGRHHAELCYSSQPGSPTMTRSEKNEIKLKLVELFQSIERHSCPDDE